MTTMTINPDDDNYRRPAWNMTTERDVAQALVMGSRLASTQVQAAAAEAVILGLLQGMNELGVTPDRELSKIVTLIVLGYLKPYDSKPALPTEVVLGSILAGIASGLVEVDREAWQTYARGSVMQR